MVTSQVEEDSCHSDLEKNEVDYTNLLTAPGFYMCALNLILGGAFKVYLCTYSTCLYKIFFALYLPLDSGVKSDMLKNVMILSNLVEILLQLSSLREWFGPVVVVGPGETVGTRIHITSNSRILTTSIALQAHRTSHNFFVTKLSLPCSNTRLLQHQILVPG